MAAACGDFNSDDPRMRATAAPDDPGTTDDQNPAPHQIGPYVVIGVLGSGAMGTVYKAQEDHPRRIVALKVIAPGVMTRDMRRRFEYEADVLARLEHPGIARIYRAGTAELTPGAPPQPYFAMELISGRRLDEYVRHENPPLTRRLELLIDICQAVHHAHTKGVIHRDLKPANILITDDGKPKVLDFGVARAIDSDVQTATMHTESGQIIGTLPYMAPEQATGKVNDLDTSSDVYALGVIAYELLSGKLPYALHGKPLHEAVRVICEEEPSRLSSIDRSLRGDVETIVQKALEKEKTRRYATAGELAADVKRFLDYEPISARPASRWYNLKKFSRRNKAIVTGVAAVMFVLLAGTAVSTYFAITATRQRAQAEQSRDEADAVNSFLSDDVFAGAAPDSIADPAIRDVIVQKMIQPAADQVGERFKDKPTVEVAVRNALALTLHSMGRSDLGLPHAERALAISRHVLGDDHPNTLSLITNTGLLMRAQGRVAEAEQLYRESLERHTRVVGENHVDTVGAITNLAVLLDAQARPEEAEPLFRTALEKTRRLFGPAHSETILAENNLGVMLLGQGKFDEAEPLLRDVLQRHRQTLGVDHPDTLTALNNIGGLLREQGKFTEAEPIWREALEGTRRVMGNDHPDTLGSINNLGYVLLLEKKYAEAEPLLRQAVDGSRRVLGADHPDTLRRLNNLLRLLQLQGRFADAAPLYGELYRQAATAQIPPKLAALYQSCYGPCLAKLGRYEEAVEPLRVGYERLKQTSQQTNSQFSVVLQALIKVADETHHPDDARRYRSELADVRATTRSASAPASQPAPADRG